MKIVDNTTEDGGARGASEYHRPVYPSRSGFPPYNYEIDIDIDIDIDIFFQNQYFNSCSVVLELSRRK
jgi:hypothetical protein